MAQVVASFSWPRGSCQWWLHGRMLGEGVAGGGWQNERLPANHGLDWGGVSWERGPGTPWCLARAWAVQKMGLEALASLEYLAQTGYGGMVGTDTAEPLV